MIEIRSGGVGKLRRQLDQMETRVRNAELFVAQRASQELLQLLRAGGQTVGAVPYGSRLELVAAGDEGYAVMARAVAGVLPATTGYCLLIKPKRGCPEWVGRLARIGLVTKAELPASMTRADAKVIARAVSHADEAELSRKVAQEAVKALIGVARPRRENLDGLDVDVDELFTVRQQEAGMAAGVRIWVPAVKSVKAMRNELAKMVKLYIETGRKSVFDLREPMSDASASELATLKEFSAFIMNRS